MKKRCMGENKLPIRSFPRNVKLTLRIIFFIVIKFISYAVQSCAGEFISDPNTTFLFQVNPKPDKKNFVNLNLKHFNSNPKRKKINQ